jgi:hypothetical protein
MVNVGVGCELDYTCISVSGRIRTWYNQIVRASCIVDVKVSHVSRISGYTKNQRQNRYEDLAATSDSTEYSRVAASIPIFSWDTASASDNAHDETNQCAHYKYATAKMFMFPIHKVEQI